MSRTHRLAVAHFAGAFVSFPNAAVMAVMQALSRADFAVPQRSERLYYLSVTAHGVLMALVFTTFFIMGLGIVFGERCLGRWRWQTFTWASFGVAVVGTLMTTAAILSGTSTVLYTFYPPMQAHWSFYVGATLLVVGSWGWCAAMLATYCSWRRESPGAPIPLPVHGFLATVIVWLLATAGLAVEVVGMLVPWSLGLIDKVDPVIARTFFWWFGHPLTYFWLIPAYVLWYTIAPKLTGGALFSDKLARVVFVLFVLFSTPVGFHHQFADPGIDASWKLLHTVTTYAILFPSLVTAFTVIASFEIGGRRRGGKGLFGWIGKLPWGDPFFASIGLAMLCFAIGGFGGAINAAYAMNAMVHNTAWIFGHFHLTVGTATALSFMGVTYWLIPRLLGRELRYPALARWQPYLWFVGMMLFGVLNHVTGLMGMPRRVYSATFLGAADAAAWRWLTLLTALGGVVLFVSSAFYLVVVAASAYSGRQIERPAISFTDSLDTPVGGRWDRFGWWTVLAVVLIAIAYAAPIHHLLSLPRFPSGPFKPF